MQHRRIKSVIIMNKKLRMLSESHKGLIEECRKGNRKAQFRLYKIYYKAMFNTSFRIVNDRFEAEDIIQEAFLKSFEVIDQFKGEVSFGAWLKRIVINKSLDALRKRKINTEPLEQTNIEPFFEPTDETSFNDEVKIAKIKREIFNLPEGYRVVLSLYLLEGYDHDEISQILGITPSSSRSQYSRAKNKLIQNLKKNSHGQN